MSLSPGESIGEETHRKMTSFSDLKGEMAKCEIDENEYTVKVGDVIIVPAGAKHNVFNVDKVADLKMYTLYGPPHHKDGIFRATKADPEKNDEEFDGRTTEQHVHIF